MATLNYSQLPGDALIHSPKNTTYYILMTIKAHLLDQAS